MYEAEVPSLPVVDDGAVVGLLARDDVIMALALARNPEAVKVPAPPARHPGGSVVAPD
jgi:predicted transcriptional regulator